MKGSGVRKKAIVRGELIDLNGKINKNGKVEAISKWSINI